MELLDTAKEIFHEGRRFEGYQLNPITRDRLFQSLARLLLLLPVLFGFLLLLPEQFWISNPVANRLDRSWYTVLCWGFLQNLSFGQELIFTYGPLGFLSTRLPFRELWMYYLGSDLLLYGGFAIAIWRFLRSSPPRSSSLIAFFVLFPLSQSQIISDLALLFSGLGFFFASSFLRTQKRFDLVFASLYSTLAFLIKVNLGIYALLSSILLLGVAHLGGPKRTILQNLGLFAVPLVLLLLLTPLSLLGYLRGAFELISGYGEVMRLEIPESFPFRFRAEVLGFAFSLAFLTSFARGAGYRDLIPAIVTAGFLFLLYEQSFVRADEWHILAMFQFAPLFLGILVIFLSAPSRPIFLPVLLLAVLFSFAEHSSLFTPEWMVSRSRGFSKYLGDLRKEPTPATPSARLLSAEMKQAIGEGTVDIATGEALLAFGNRLNYRPRPVFQSYAAFTPYLDRINADFYRSPRAPDFSLFENICIDQRYCFGDEPETKLSLLEHFHVQSRDGGMLLLKRDPERRRTLVRTALASGELKGGEWFHLPPGEGALLIRLSMHRAWSRDLSNLFMRAQPLVLELQKENGSINRFHTASSLLRAGLLADPFLSSNDSIEAFFRGEFEKLPHTVALRIVLERSEAAPNFHFDGERITLAGTERSNLAQREEIQQGGPAE